MESTNILSKLFYIISISLVLVASLIINLAIALFQTSMTMEALLFLSAINLPLYIFVITIMSRLWFKAWQSIQDGYTRTTPGKAIGFAFIPLFNIYWIFQLSYGFSKDYNAYIRRYKINITKLPEKLFLWLPIFIILTSLLSMIPIIGQFIAILASIIPFIYISYICDAVNKLPQRVTQIV